MNVTRDVILDVWPLYEANEVSRDTRALVEAFLSTDPEFARTLQGADAAARRVLGAGVAAVVSEAPPSGGRAPAPELKPVVEGVRRRLTRQRWVAGAAVFASLLPLSVGNLGGGTFLMIRSYPALWLAIPVAVGLWIWLWRTTKGAA